MKKARLLAEERKAAIVQAALPLFARKGYAETTTKELARAAGVSEPLLYRHFPSKEALYLEIQNLCCQGNDPYTRKFLHLLTGLEPSTSTLVHLVYYLVRVQLFGKPFGPIEWDTRQRLMLKSLLEDGAFARLMYQNRFDAFCNRIEACLEAAVAAGDADKTPLSPGNNARFAHHLGAWLALVHLPSKPAMNYKVSREELVHQAAWFILSGMGLKRKAIATYYNPKVLDLYFEIVGWRMLATINLFSMMKKLTLLGACAAILGAAGCKREAPTPPQPLKVMIVTVSPRDVPVYQQWIGTLDGYPNAQIRAQVSGYLLKQNYLEGSRVKQGDLLFEIDARPFQAALDQALGKLAQDQAMMGKTELDVSRFTPLAKEKAVSQQELDDAVQSNLMAKAALAADKAAVESATLNLEFCKITSPIDGIAGTAQAQIGDLVGPGASVLTTVSTIDPIRAYFSISEQSYLAFCRQFTNAAERAAYRAEMELQLILSDGSIYPLPGKWFFTSRQVDINTGTLQIAGLFPNPDNMLRPGQYALVRAKIETRHGAMLLPQRAVTELQGAYQVATVDARNTAHIKTVKMGEQVGNDWIIESGLAPNDRVIAEGVQKIKEGTVVDPQLFAPAQAEQPPAVRSVAGKQG